jgi:hypothetical protein
LTEQDNTVANLITRRSVTIRNLLVLTAICAAAIAYLWPLYDDSPFVDGFEQMESRTVANVIEHCKYHSRELGINENSRGGLLGLHAYSKDDHMIALDVEPIHASNCPTGGWQLEQLTEMPIRSINVYDLRSMRKHQNKRFP